MSPVLEKPILHGRDHCPGGADPIPCMPDLSEDDSYIDIILAHPCVVHYWPCDEASGDLVDRVGAWDLEPLTGGGWDPPSYGAEGPLPELPEYTAVVNAGNSGAVGSPSRFSYDLSSAPAFWTTTAEFAVEFWTHLTAYGTSSGTTVFFEAISLSQVLQVHLYSAVGSPKGLSVTRGAATISDPDDLPLDQWQHVVVNFTGTELELWRNAELVASAAHSSSVTLDDSVAWLNKNAANWYPTNGRGAHLAIYDCALTEAEISSHLSAQDALGAVPEGYVLTSDGEGGYSWQPGGSGVDDALAWMPLADSDGTLILDGDDLIPTLIPIG